MKVRVRLFAGMRERVGKSELAVELPEGADVTALQARSRGRIPGAEP